MTFNLVDEPFLPCILPDGQRTSLGLMEVLARAPVIHEIRDESPPVTGAAHRLLLAILHRSLDGPKSLDHWNSLWSAKQFPMETIAAYLEDQRLAFDIFQPGRPFFQDPSFAAKQTNPISRLAKDMASGNNATLFDHTTEMAAPELAAPHVARLLIAEHPFAIGGGKSERGYTTNGPLIGGVSLLAVGANLFETLMLNLLVYNEAKPIPRIDEDLPCWERNSSDRLEYPRGYLDLLTWQSRALRLRVGAGGRTVVGVDYAQGRPFKPGNGFFEPTMCYREKGDGAFRSVRFRTQKALWRDSAVLFRWARKEQGGLLNHLARLAVHGMLAPGVGRKLAAIGLCNDRARVDFWRHEVLPLRTEYLNDDGLLQDLDRSLVLTEDVGAAVRSAGWRAAKETLKSGDNEPDKKRVADLLTSLSPDRLYWSRLEAPFYSQLDELLDPATRPEKHRLWFDLVLRKTALDAFHETFGQCDRSARSLKALAIGESFLRSELSALRRQHIASDLPLQEQDNG